MRLRVARLFYKVAVVGAPAPAPEPPPPPPPPPPPSDGVLAMPPQGVMFTGSTAGERVVSWAASPSLANGQPIEGDPPTAYRIYRSNASIPYDISGLTPALEVAAPALSGLLTGMPAGMNYVRVTAVNGAGESNPSNEFEGTV